MKALVKTEPGYNKMELLEIEKPVPKDREVLVKVIYTGICGTDIHGFKGEYDRLKTPLVLGHEFSGVVEAIGKMSRKFKKGHSSLVKQPLIPVENVNLVKIKNIIFA